MTRFFQILRAELIRDVTTSLRYPIELIGGLIIMFALFMALYSGGKALAGGNLLAGSREALVLGFCMWFLAIISINSMSVDIENEARQGTLEQLYICSPNFLLLLWTRGAVHLLTGSSMVFVLSFLLQFATGSWLHLSLATLGPVVLVIALAVAGLLGFGLILGGFSIVFKRIGQMAAMLQFALLFLALPHPGASPLLTALIHHLPLARAVDLLRGLLAAPGSPTALGPGDGALWAGIAWLALDSAVYAALGSLIFGAMEKKARRQGALGHY